MGEKEEGQKGKKEDSEPLFAVSPFPFFPVFEWVIYV
jgi:hypothetical protein